MGFCVQIGCLPVQRLCVGVTGEKGENEVVGYDELREAASLFVRKGCRDLRLYIGRQVGIILETDAVLRDAGNDSCAGRFQTIWP